MNFKDRSYQKELLDKDDIPFEDLLINLRELNTVNTYLGGHKVTLSGLDYFLNTYDINRQLVIAEIGCGGGDNLTVIGKYMVHKKKDCRLIGIDIKPECIQFGKQNAATNIDWICSDYRTVTWPNGKPDIIFSSLFCHHFTDAEMVDQLKWLRENSRLGFFINDLHRHYLAYYSIKVITGLFSKSYLVRNDAPLSVRRGFKRKEWVSLLAAAGISDYSVKWKWAFRHLICVLNERA